MPDTAVERFAGWLTTDIAPALRGRGLTKTGSSFHRRGADGWGVVNFQKSQFGSRAHVRFTINIGVGLDRVLAAQGHDPSRKPPSYRCSWQLRIGELIDDGEDHWWDLDACTDLDRLTAQIVAVVIERGLPLMETRLTEEGFVEAATGDFQVGRVS